MISRTISVAAIAAAAVWLGGCSSSETSTLANGLIAGATLTDKDDVSAGAKIGQTQGTTFSVAEGDVQDTLDVSWNSGPYSNKTRTFALADADGGIGKYEYVKQDGNDKDEGVLFVGSSVSNAGFALGAMHTEGKADAAAGAAHFGATPTNIPTSGSLTYHGMNAGVTVNDGENKDQLAPFTPGNATILANFGNGDVNGTLESADLSTITFNGKMSAGNSVYAANNEQIFYGGEGVGSNSKLIGGFYGDGAMTTAGVYDVTTLGETPIRAIGGFTADTGL
jgi:hypothetical protein